MGYLTSDLVPSAEAYRARAKHAESRRSEALRICGLAMTTTMALGWTRLAEVVSFTPILRAEFALSGFLIVDMLIGGRSKLESGLAKLAGPRASDFQEFWQAFPGTHLFALIITVLLLPEILALESVTLPKSAEFPAAVVTCLRSNLGEFLSTTFDGRSLIVWPLILSLAPTRLLGLGGLTLVGGGLLVQTTVFLGSDVGPASILVSPTPVDLVSGGALLAAILQGFGRSEHGPLARWALLMGVALASGLIASRIDGGSASLAVLSAPAGFGALNFILELIATSLIGSLIWRDVDSITRDGLG